MLKISRLTFCVMAILPFCLLGKDISIRVGANHSWLYYPDEFIQKLAENEFNPGLSFGLNASAFSKGNFTSAYGIRFFSVGRFDKIGDTNGEAEIKHYYLSIPLQFEYLIIPGFKPYLNVEPAYQIKSRLKYELEGSPANEDRTITDEMNRFNLFLGVGLKYLFTLSKHELAIGGQINYGLLRISKDKLFDVTPEGSRGWLDWRAREILFALEYFFHL